MPQTQHFKIGFLNAGFLGTGHDELVAAMDCHNLDILALNETWLKAGEEGRAPLVPGYRLCHKPRPSEMLRKRGGGVGFYIRKEVSSQIINQPNNTIIEQMWMRTVIKGKRIIVGTAYRPPCLKPRILFKFELMFEELSNKFSSILVYGNTGVLVDLAKACLRIKSKQMQYIQCLEKALNCTDAEPKHFAIQCLKMTPLGANTDKEYFIHVHGSVILQTMLGFQRPARPVSSILELTSDELVYVLSDAKGCHVTDAFSTGQFVGVKARDKLIWKLKGYYQKLALSQHSLSIFNAASIEQKVKIMTEISDKSNLLNSTSYGRLIATKLDINTFKLSPKNWEQSRLKKPE